MKKIIPLLLLFFVFSFLFRSDFSFDQDLGRHIKLGEIIYKTHSVPSTNLFSYTNPDFPFINTHWLFEVMAFFFNQTIGINWFLYLKIIIILIAVWLTIRQKSYLLLPIGFIFLHVLRERLDLRPEIFSFLFTALTLYILKSYVRKDQPCEAKLIFLLPIIQLLWINTHIYFFVGLVLQAIYLVSFRKKIFLIIFALSVAVSFINPNGLNGVIYPLNVSSNYGYTIVENQTMFLLESINFTDKNFFFVKIIFAIIALSLFAGYKRRTLNLLNLLLISFGSGLALLNVRGFPYLIFICLPPVLENFGQFKSKILLFISILLLILESFLYLNGNYYKYTNSSSQVNLTLPQSGKAAMDFVLSNNLPGPIYNNFDIGSYIIYRSFPKYKVFVDGRPEAYPKEFFQNIYIPAKYENFDFKTIIFSHTDQTPWGKAFLSSISKDKTWNLLFLDDSMVVYSKTGTPIGLNKLEPNLYQFSNHVSYLRIANFLLNTGYTAWANEFYLKAQSIFPKLGNTYFW